MLFFLVDKYFSCSAPDTVTYCIWMWSRSFSIESLCVDALWQCVVLRVTCWFLSFCMSQSHPSISWAGLSPHALYQPDFDGHMLPLCLAGRSFEETQQKMATVIGATHTHRRPQTPTPKNHRHALIWSYIYTHTSTNLYVDWCSSCCLDELWKDVHTMKSLHF